MIQRYIINKPSATVTVDGAVEGQAIAVEWCKSEDVAELEARYAKLDKYCLALFYAVCGLTCTDMTEEERADALRDANEAKSRFADDSDFWFIVDLNDDGGGDK